MKVVVAIDSFKGSLSSLQAGKAVKDAILRLKGDAQVVLRPLADGGEGTVAAVKEGVDSDLIRVTVKGPLAESVTCEYCILKGNHTALIEMASAAGLTLVPPEARNPLETSTYGVGELIRDAIRRGCRRLIVGIGGSATNDGGAGMLMALGYEFLDANGDPIALGAKGLRDLCSIKTDRVLPELKDCTFCIACDVHNPLCGETGCSAVFGPQKGATPEMAADMDAWLGRYAEITRRTLGHADPTFAGAGAAGGLGFAFLSFTNAELRSGVDVVLQAIGLEEDVRDADIVVTGEGRLDAQTVLGKAPIGVAGLAKQYGKRVIAFSGCVAEGAELCNEHGIDAFFPILRNVVSLEEALDAEKAYRNLESTAYQVFRLLI